MSLVALQSESVQTASERMEELHFQDDQAALAKKMMTDVAALHRSGGYVAFAQNPPEGQMRLGKPIHVSWLQSIFPEFAAEYLWDGYVGINSILPDARWRGTDGLPATLQAWDWRRKHSAQRNDYVEWLNACFCDVDCDDCGIPISVVKEAMGQLVRDEVVPAPTAVHYSGGGVWFLWYLCDPQCPLSSHKIRSPQDHNTYRAVNGLLGKPLDGLGRDAQAVQPMQWTGLSETRKTKYGGKKVTWEAYPGGRFYTLDELAAWVGYKTPELVVMPRKVSAEESRPATVNAAAPTKRDSSAPRSQKSLAGESGYRAYRQNIQKHFYTLMSLRGGYFVKGQRNAASFVLAAIMRSIRVPEDEAREKLADFGLHFCKNPLSARACAKKVRASYAQVPGSDGRKSPRRNITYQAIANKLDVTERESQEMTHQVGSVFPPSARFGTVAPVIGTKGKRERRIAALSAIRVQQGGAFTRPYRDLIVILMIEHGISVSLGTLSGDLKKLGWRTPAMRDDEVVREVQRA